jgi:hypothetical protein
MSLEVATTIKQQLIGLGAIKVMSWGAHAWTGTKDALLFKVQGHHFKGIVKITLTPMDVYKIEFLKGTKQEIVKTFEDVFFDEMVEIIDKYVEYIPAYEGR